MLENITQIATGILISTLSFLGWKTEEYIKYLTPEIKKNIEIFSENSKELLTSEKQEDAKEKISSTSPAINKPEQPKIEQKIETKIIPKKINIPKVEIPEIKISEKTKPIEPIQKVEKNYANSLANLYCTIYRLPYIQTITGSAVSVEKDNIYLTNAHLGIYVLLENAKQGGNISCVLREGSPAKKSSKVKVVFISPKWILNNPGASEALSLSGTGESDYAIILRESSITSSPLKISEKILKKNDAINLGGYPAFNQSIIQDALYPLVEETRVESVFFKEVASGLVDTKSTPIAQIGSSGGGAITDDGKVVGIITAAIKKVPGNQSSARIISIGYIKNQIKKESGKSFEEIIQNAKTESDNFIKNSTSKLIPTITKAK